MTAARCPVCDARGVWRVVAVPGPDACPRAWRRCNTCGSLFVWPPPTREALAPHFLDAAYGRAELAESITRDKEPLLAELFARVAAARPPGPHLLDVGCSFGGLLTRARAEGFTAEGLDPHPAAVAAVKALGFPAHCAWSLTEPPFAAASFDVVTSIDVLYYAPEPLVELRAAARVLRPGGVLAIRTTNKAWLALAGGLALRVTSLAGAAFRAAVHDHLSSVPPSALTTALARTGFADITVTGGATTVPLARAERRTRLAYGLTAALARLTGGRVELSPGVLVMARRTADLATRPAAAV